MRYTYRIVNRTNQDTQDFESFEDAIEFLKGVFNQYFDGSEESNNKAYLVVGDYLVFIGSLESKDPIKFSAVTFIKLLGGQQPPRVNGDGEVFHNEWLELHKGE